MLFASVCPSVWGAYVDMILVSSMPLVPLSLYGVVLYVFALILSWCHTYLIPLCLFDAHLMPCTHYYCHMHCLISIEPHRSAMWSFAQPIDLPLLLVACLRLPCTHFTHSTLSGSTPIQLYWFSMWCCYCLIGPSSMSSHELVCSFRVGLWCHNGQS